MTPEQSAMRACIAYQREAALIERLSRQIGEALNRCKTLNPEVIDGEQFPGSLTHLRAAYGVMTSRAPDDIDQLSPDDVMRLLSGREPPDNLLWCPTLSDYAIPAKHFQCCNCADAHRLIQERKNARQRFGAAKRSVRLAGKKADEVPT